MTDPMDARATVFRFGPFRLVAATRALTRDGQPVRLGGRALDILIALIERAGQVVGKDELIERVWQGVFLEESNLRVHVAALRRALDDGGSGTRLIATVPGRGYSFVGSVTRLDAEDAGGGAAPSGYDSLPMPLIRIVGRDAVVQEGVEQLPDRRFVTLTGAGGIGKTAVALAIAQRVAHAYADGVQFVDLAPLSSSRLVPAHLASLLRLSSSDAVLQSIIDHLRRRRMLLVLDSCEHVVEALSALAEDILRWAPGIHILATSREPLRAMGEWVLRLGPLPVPPISATLTAAEALRFPAVQLLVERVRASGGAFDLTDADAAIAAELCARLDGLPLAIELAAARVPLYGLGGVADRLGERFCLLTRGRRTAAPRHQTLGAMIDWSHGTLDGPERRLWRRLSVFSGSFSFEAADAVGQGSDSDGVSVADILDSLIEKSLVALDPGPEEIRYRLLESTRLYALDKLAESGETEATRRRHARYFHARSLSSGEDWAETPTDDWLRRYGGDIAEIRAALDWAFSSPADQVLAVTLAAASAPLWFKLLLVPELRDYLERAVQLAAASPEIDDGLVMRLHVALGHAIFHTSGHVPGVHDALSRALAIGERRGDVNCQLQLLWALYGYLGTKGDYPGAMACVERFREVAVHSDDPLTIPTLDRMTALGLHLLGDQAGAMQSAERALAHPAARQRTRSRVFVYDHTIATSAHYARILWVTGRPDRARAVMRAVMDDARTMDQPFAFGSFVVFAGYVVPQWLGDVDMARRAITLLCDVAAGVASNVWEIRARFHETVMAALDSGDAAIAAINRQLADDDSLTDFYADNLSTIDWRLLQGRSLARAERGDVSWCTAELLRAKGERLIASRGDAARHEADALFQRALDLSRRQAALSWELRSAMSLARLWRGDARRDATDRLADVYGRFTEGFETRDLLDARQLLEALSAEP